jgi:SAM-dependent methyltransferase
VREGRRFTRPLTEEEVRDEKKSIDPWVLVEGVAGKRVLCLGAGGGRQGPVYARAGAIVTVVDVSAMQLELDREVATRMGLGLRTMAVSMDDMPGLVEGEFDVVVQPVSTCYVPDIEKVYREVARVMRGGGLYVSQHKQPTSLQADIRRTARGYEVTEPYYRSGPLPESGPSLHREPGTLEYLHRWEQMVGGLCRAGFVVEDLAEPYHADPAARLGSFEDRSRFVPPYVRIKARRVGGPERSGLIEKLVGG